MKKEMEIVKSNPLVEASYRLTSAEQCIILSCISQIHKEEKVTDEVMYKVSVSDYVTLTGADPKSAYRDIKEAAERLDTRRVRIYELPNGGGKIKNKNRMIKLGWVQTIAYTEGCGEVELRFNKDMLPYLTSISGSFTKYKLKHVVKMSSSFGVRLYELLVEWKDRFRAEEQEVSLEWLKRVLQVEGKYSSIKDFKKYVLNPAISDVNKHSDFRVSWEQKKTGRKISHLKFIFKLKKDRHGGQKSKRDSLTSWKSHIESNARPGETYVQASERLKKNNRKLVETT